MTCHSKGGKPVLHLLNQIRLLKNIVRLSCQIVSPFLQKIQKKSLPYYLLQKHLKKNKLQYSGKTRADLPYSDICNTMRGIPYIVPIILTAFYSITGIMIYLLHINIYVLSTHMLHFVSDPIFSP